MKKIIILVAAIALAGCNETQVVTSYRWMVIHPSESMYYCPILKQWPNWKTLTDSQVAKTVVQLHKNNLTCKSSLESIRKFLKESDETIKKGSN